MKQRSSPGVRQALRTTPVPAALGSWLDAINGLPNDDGLLFDLANQILPLWVARTNSTEREREQRISTLRERTKDWGRVAADYVFRLDSEGNLEPGDRLRELCLARIAFREIAQLSGGPLHTPVLQGATAVIDGGIIRIRLAPFLELLKGIEASRIRQCPICTKLFWAGRRDKSACTEECSRVLRQRRLRENRAYRKAHPKTKLRS